MSDRTGLSPSFGRPVLSSLLPPGSSRVQLTHCDDVAGAAVFGLLARLSGSYYVCSAPSTLQRLVDVTAEARCWENTRLREAREGEGEDSAPKGPELSAAKLVAAGYELQWPELAPPRPTAEAASAGEAATVGSARTTGAADGGGDVGAEGHAGVDAEGNAEGNAEGSAEGGTGGGVESGAAWADARQQVADEAGREPDGAVEEVETEEEAAEEAVEAAAEEAAADDVVEGLLDDERESGDAATS